MSKQFNKVELTVRRVDGRYICEDWNVYWGNTTRIFDTLDETIEHLKRFFERKKQDADV